MGNHWEIIDKFHMKKARIDTLDEMRKTAQKPVAGKKELVNCKSKFRSREGRVDVRFAENSG